MSSYLLQNARLIDGGGGPVVEQTTILIKNGKITSVTATTPDMTKFPPEGKVLDLNGRTVMPLVIDGHLHITGMPGLLDEAEMLRDNLLATQRLRECLLAGTGMVGHAGGSETNLILRDLINTGALPECSRLLVSGVVTATGGHVRGEGADGPWAIRRLVRKLSTAGVDFFKTCATGGFQWAHEGLGNPDYTLEELQVLVDEAHTHNKRVHVHAHAKPGLDNAIEAGCDVILHGAEIDEASLEKMAAKNLWYMPTLYVTSERMRTDYNLPAHMSTRMASAAPIHRAGVNTARHMGIRIIAGSDGPPTPGAIMHEITELAACGLTPMEAIVAATRETADAFGLLKTLGTLELGKQADLLVVDGDPLTNLKLLTKREKIFLIMKDGKIIKGASIN